MSRILIKGIISMALSLLVVFALIIMFGIYFSYKNYLLLIFYYFLSTIMLYGISLRLQELIFYSTYKNKFQLYLN